MDVTDLTTEGGKLNATQAAELEEQSQQNPDDTTVRTKLLGYYFRKQYEDPSVRTLRQSHILWLIENAPASDVLRISEGHLNNKLEADAYGEAKEAWQKQLEDKPNNLKILENAASFFDKHDRETAKQLLEKAKAIEPKNQKWPAKLGQIYELEMIGRSGKSRAEAATKALEQLEIAYDLSDAINRDPLLTRLARSAFEARQIDKAKKYATEMLDQQREDWNAGNNVHYGNITLGRIALAQNDVEEAKQYLLAAGKTKGSPQLNSFGPNMILANELLKLGENEAVLEYFDLCSKFWDMGDEKLKQWSATVKEGGTQDFGGKLYY